MTAETTNTHPVLAAAELALYSPDDLAAWLLELSDSEFATVATAIAKVDAACRQADVDRFYFRTEGAQAFRHLLAEHAPAPAESDQAGEVESVEQPALVEPVGAAGDAVLLSPAPVVDVDASRIGFGDAPATALLPASGSLPVPGAPVDSDYPGDMGAADLVAAAVEWAPVVDVVHADPTPAPEPVPVEPSAAVEPEPLPQRKPRPSPRPRPKPVTAEPEQS